MKTIKEHIKKQQFKPVYLLYGSEDYLKKFYKNKLKEAILADGDEMNLSIFEGKNIDVNEMIQIAETMPFFSERRVIIIENSGLFKAQSDLADYIKNMPDTTYLVFVEAEVDKRNRLFKAAKEVGYISEMNGMDEKNLKLWALSILNKDGKKITDQTMTYFLERVGSDMENLRTELEKVICYALEREIITIEDINAVCTEQITNKIFLMIDAIAQKNEKRALGLYYDLVMLKEKPMSILYLIIRHFHILLGIKSMNAAGTSSADMASKLSIPPFAVSKYMTQARNFELARIKECIQYGIELEEDVKNGRIHETIGVELMIIQTVQ